MPRLLFHKTGDAVWMSHLDLMRLFQRAFKRAGLHLQHTQGFNPRPSVSIALPLSVGVESHCELLDFDLDGQAVSYEQIQARLNEVLVTGVKVLSVYQMGGKIKDLAYLDCEIDLEYNAGVPEGAMEAVAALLKQDSLIVDKKSKNGIVQQDIIPMICKAGLRMHDAHVLTVSARICCQNPSLNPMQIVSAIEGYLPQYKPDFSKCRRLEIFDREEKIFR